MTFNNTRVERENLFLLLLTGDGSPSRQSQNSLGGVFGMRRNGVLILQSLFDFQYSTLVTVSGPE